MRSGGGVGREFLLVEMYSLNEKSTGASELRSKSL
jgi:hypothetical protein